MKSHINATIESDLLDALQRIRKRERRSLSNVLEAAVAEYVEKRCGGGADRGFARYFFGELLP